MTIAVTVANHPSPPGSFRGFVEADGVVAMEAAHFTAITRRGKVGWQEIPDYGRTGSAMAPFPMTALAPNPVTTAPCLEYSVWLSNPKDVKVDAVLSPSLAFQPGRGLRYAVSFDDQAPVVVDASAPYLSRAWETSVKDSAIHSVTTHRVTGSGRHVLKIWMVDPGIVLQRIVLDLGGLRPSYLGPPESTITR